MKADLKLGVALAIGAASTIVSRAFARILDPSKAEYTLETMKRTQCGEADRVPAVYFGPGKFIPG